MFSELNVFLNILAWAELIDREWQKSSDPDARVFAVPEAVAQVACYFSSLQRESGLHAIIDIGSGTTDVSIFNLQDRFHDMVPY